MNPRWHGAMQLALDGIQFRVRDGKKAEGDLVLEWLTPQGWRPITMAVALMLNDFHFCVEEHLYPQERGYKGGNKWNEAVRWSYRHGWQKTWAGVLAEKAASPRNLFDQEAS